MAGDQRAGECDHDWREEPHVTYTSNPPMKRDVCPSCGESRFRKIGEFIAPPSANPQTWPKAPVV